MDTYGIYGSSAKGDLEVLRENINEFRWRVTFNAMLESDRTEENLEEEIVQTDEHKDE
ncbi:hypothetical protein J6590_042448 [Homalodisca vitripennis]|nr:hypothetical protein J6590_042448 [Homalodisca vitripennis]